mmetsp:Transcript_4341/g.6551  ORF Transcript_4341/g.6551 Transcript_4341/m.6551 type:complete len:92 (-) Transcript_4341:50-325(-)
MGVWDLTFLEKSFPDGSLGLYAGKSFLAGLKSRGWSCAMEKLPFEFSENLALASPFGRSSKYLDMLLISGPRALWNRKDSGSLQKLMLCEF